jgi:hypothetical protein
MKSIEITPDALALAAYFQTLFAPGRDAEALEAGGQLLELQRHFRVSQAQETFPIGLPELQDRITAALRDSGVPD